MKNTMTEAESLTWDAGRVGEFGTNRDGTPRPSLAEVTARRHALEARIAASTVRKLTLATAVIGGDALYAPEQPFDMVGFIMDFEDGQLDEDAIISGFQHLIDSGLAWSLQGSYGRAATALIEQGHCHVRQYVPGKTERMIREAARG